MQIRTLIVLGVILYIILNFDRLAATDKVDLLNAFDFIKEKVLWLINFIREARN